MSGNSHTTPPAGSGMMQVLKKQEGSRTDPNGILPYYILKEMVYAELGP